MREPFTVDNPLLQTTGLPLHAAIRPEHVAPAIDVLLADAEAALARAVDPTVPANYHALALLLDTAVERLSRVWGTVGHLNQVADTPALRAAYNDELPRVTAFFARLGADAALFAKYRGIDVEGLDMAQRRAIANAVRDFRLGGAELRGDAHARFLQIRDRVAELGQRFDEHVQDATDAFVMVVDASRLAGVPADVLTATRADAQTRGHPSGHALTLQYPRWLPVMQYAADRSLREALWRAYFGRASELGPPAHDNSALMSELLRLRREEAALLGFASFAELSLATKMARSPEQVLQFLRDLARRARPQAERDADEMRRFARDALGIGDLQPWDHAFVAERLREQRYAFNEQQLKAYFTAPRVVDGLFRLIEALCEVHIAEEPAQTWHDSVRFYRIEREGCLIGQFYLDLYARPGKRPGAWMDHARSRWRRPEAGASLQTPVATLICNFAPPVGEQPALLTHDDVVTLFHEFGHGLHHLLTRVDELAVAGISGVEWDAVELPSQFMENFCWEWDVLRTLSGHVTDGSPLPHELFDRLRAARNFHSALVLLRQVEYALVDMRLHLEPDAPARIQEVIDEVRREVAVFETPPGQRFLHSFSHIFAGGYSAGYYSYQWAEVLSADAFAAFEEAGLFDAGTRRRYRREILEVGGSRDAMASFKAFRGREPSIAALLRHQGIA